MNKCALRVVLCIASASLCAGGAVSDACAQTPDSTPANMLHEFVSDVAHGVTAPARWNAKSIRKLATGIAVTAALTPLDGVGRSLMLRNQSRIANDVTGVVEPLGMEASMPIVAGIGVMGLILKDTRLQSTAAGAAASSVVAAGMITPALKYAFGRLRPREGKDPYDFRPFSGNESMPSGHTTQAFAIASVVATEYNEGWVKYPVYGLAAGVAVSRMYHGAHYLSDIAAGAMIGTATGRSIARHMRTVRRPADGGGHSVNSFEGEKRGEVRIELSPGVMPNGSAGVVMQIKY